MRLKTHRSVRSALTLLPPPDIIKMQDKVPIFDFLSEGIYNEIDMVGEIKTLLKKDTVLNEFEASKILRAYGVPFPPTFVARSAEEARAVAQKLVPPLVMKVLSRDIPHKAHVGGVVFGVTPETAASAYQKIVERVQSACPKAQIQGILLQEQQEGGVEVIIGAFKDQQFGHVVMFGLGGVFAELLKDVTFRVVPLSEKDAQEMIQETKAASLLSGLRGQPSADLQALCSILVNVSRLVNDYPEISELDINPVLVTPKGPFAVDALIRVTSSQEVKSIYL